MPEATGAGPLFPLPTVPTTPASPPIEGGLDGRDRTIRKDDFATYLNQQEVMFEKQAEQSRVFDTAGQIAQDSVYRGPGVTTPT